jgi:hypothetical protein
MLCNVLVNLLVAAGGSASSLREAALRHVTTSVPSTSSSQFVVEWDVVVGSGHDGSNQGCEDESELHFL